MRAPEELALIASIADDLPAGVWVAAVPDGRFVYANRAFEEIMGMGPVDVGVGEYAQPYGIYGRDGLLYPEDKLPFVRALRARATVVVDDIVIHRRDGRRVYVRAVAKPMLDAAGEMKHVAIAFFDITREVEAEGARSRAEDRLRHVVGGAPIVLFSFKVDGTLTLLEGSGFTRLGRAPNEFIGRSVFDAYPDVFPIGDACRRALAGETVNQVVEVASVVYDAHLAPLRDEAGAVVGAIGVAVDVTDRHRAEVKLAQAERLASVGLLAAGVVHEINNPLSFVIGNLDLVARQLATNAPPTEASARVLADAVSDARQGAERVRAIVRDLKVFSRVQERRAAAVDVRVPLRAALAMAQNELRHRARVVLALGPAPLVWADEGRLGQLFLNLLVNAAQAIEAGAAEANEVRVETAADANGWARIEIRDTGAGVPRELLPKIFDPFFTTKEPGVGTGLGLSICHSIATDVGGRIEVDSEPGRGSTFCVLLPPAATTTQTTSNVARESATARERLRVMVVDDEPLILKIVASLLAPEHDVTCEGRASNALDRVRAGESFDAILCDLMMPETTGMDLYDALLEMAPAQAARVLFLTGGAFTARAREFLDRVPNATLEKPFDAATLLARIRQVAR